LYQYRRREDVQIAGQLPSGARTAESLSRRSAALCIAVSTLPLAAELQRRRAATGPLDAGQPLLRTAGPRGTGDAAGRLPIACGPPGESGTVRRPEHAGSDQRTAPHRRRTEQG